MNIFNCDFNPLVLETLVAPLTYKHGKLVPAHRKGKEFVAKMKGCRDWVYVPEKLTHLTPSVGVVGNHRLTFGTDGVEHLHLYHIGLKEFKERLEKGVAVKPAITLKRDWKYKHPYLQLMEYL